MTIFIAGLVLFFGIHMVPEIGGLRATIVSTVSEKGYKGLFALASLVGIIMIIWGFGHAGNVDLYTPPTWARWPAIILMPIALILQAAANMKGRIRMKLRHPMMIGIGLWACVHMFANGDRNGVILFASFLGYTVLSIWSANRRGPAPSYEAVARKDASAVIAGIVVYVVLLFAHPFLFGKNIF